MVLIGARKMGKLARASLGAAVLSALPAGCQSTANPGPRPAPYSVRESGSIPAHPESAAPVRVPAPAPAAPDTQARVINTMCPIGGDDFEEPIRPATLAREWKGQTIGFCCKDCAMKFDRMKPEERDETLTRARANRAPD
jgi:hypothetical protein